MLVYKFKFGCVPCEKVILSENPDFPANCLSCRRTELSYLGVRRFDEFDGEVDPHTEILALINRLKKTNLDVERALTKLAGRFKTHYPKKES